MKSLNDYKETDLIGYGPVMDVWNVNGTRILRNQQEIWHSGLNEHKVVSGSDYNIMNNKVEAQVAKWTEKWDEVCEKKEIQDAKNASTEEANRRTAEAERALAELNSILLYALDVNDIVNWDLLKNRDTYKVPYPQNPLPPNYYIYPQAPDRNSLEFKVNLKLFEKVLKSKKEKAVTKAESNFKSAYDEWSISCEEIQRENEIIEKKYKKEMLEFTNKVAAWNDQKDKFLKNQNEFNQKIDDLKTRYIMADASAILEHCEIVLNSSVLPYMFKKDFELEYNPDSKILIIDYVLPSIEYFPRNKEVKYIATRNELKVLYRDDAFMEKLFDDTTYKLILRILHEEFEADVINAIDAISFNGWVNSLNRATGKREDACIVSIQVNKDKFTAIELRHVDPKACFKNLKGVGSSKLAGITPINPILTISKSDKRFVESHNVTNTFDDSTNLAAIPWEEFEHLVREIFEAEFCSNGGEVKVTQASRDGGVDAIAFDPDPIRGGKIVIQAKRYTNTVGVSAVRDLFGTVINEGATKGILVTTADYGPDAYEFAKNKPITLLNGGHLLHLMKNQGHKARIDLKEAKELNLGNSRSC